MLDPTSQVTRVPEAPDPGVVMADICVLILCSLLA